MRTFRRSAVDDALAEALGKGHKNLGYRAHDKGADNSSQPKGSAQQKACGNKKAVCQDTDNAEGLMDFVADDNSHKVVGACACLGFNDDGHSKGKDDTAGNQDNDTSCNGKGAVDVVSQQNRKQINNGTAQKHADNGSDPYVAPVDQEQYKNDQKTDHHMGAAVGPVKGIRPRDTAEDSLHKYIEGISAQIRLDKKGYAQMGN